MKVVIQSLEDARNGKPLIDGITQKDVEDCGNVTIGILEKGMQSGKTSLMFLIKDKDGKVKVAQCSAAQFEMLISAVRGAVQRFEENGK